LFRLDEKAPDERQAQFMPSNSTREETILNLFLQGYDDLSWHDATRDWVDRRLDGGVELVATRSDRTTLAVEHTLIEFFIGERTDFERFKGFLAICDDTGVWVPGKLIEISIPRDTLLPGFDWSKVVREFQLWLRQHIHEFPEGYSTQHCPVSEPNSSNGSIELSVRVLKSDRHNGRPFINRYGQVDIGQTVRKALRAKLPKLTATDANRKILMLERNQFKMNEQEIVDAVERSRQEFPLLDQVDELWLVETIGFDQSPEPGNRGFIDFRRYENGSVTEQFSFNQGVLSRSDNS
jgi:hypothetical protein